MNAASIITKVHAVGGHIEAYDGKLRLTAPKPLPENLMSQIRAYKLDLLVTLGQSEVPDQAEAVEEYLEERAAIQEYDGELTREQAEAGSQPIPLASILALASKIS